MLRRCIVSFGMAIYLLRAEVSLAFAPSSRLSTYHRLTLLLQTNDSGDHDEDADDSVMDRFRKSLEASWDVKSMGIVPTDAESAAEATAAALESADAGATKDIFFVNILVPQYDISSGGKYYDEVLAVEFCIALAQRLSEPSMICVRDSVVLNPVQRILDAREKAITNKDEAAKASSSSSTIAQSEDPFEDVVRKSAEEDDNVQSEPDDVQNFRAKLMADWAPTASSSVNDDASSKKKDTSKDAVPNTEVSDTKVYRLTSLLGDARSLTTTNTPSLANMNEIVEAVSKNALPKKHERYIILLAPSTKEEMIGIRALVQKYSGGSNRFILVNNKLDPLPVELHDAETVYSVLPMIGQQIKGNIRNEAAPKVVVLRRYPRDWELYVDIGQGFDLAASCGLDGLKGGSYVTGPSKRWIQSSLEAYLIKMR